MDTINRIHNEVDFWIETGQLSRLDAVLDGIRNDLVSRGKAGKHLLVIRAYLVAAWGKRHILPSYADLLMEFKRVYKDEIDASSEDLLEALEKKG
jgi:hypothetical protein